jgi:hypothetical protein
MRFLPEDVRKVMGKFEIRSSKLETNSKRKKGRADHGSCRMKKLCEEPALRLCEKEKLPEGSNVFVVMGDQRVRGEVRLVVERM